MNLSAQTSGEVSVLPLRKATTKKKKKTVHKVREKEKTAEALHVSLTDTPTCNKPRISNADVITFKYVLHCVIKTS